MYATGEKTLRVNLVVQRPLYVSYVTSVGELSNVLSREMDEGPNLGL